MLRVLSIDDSRAIHAALDAMLTPVGADVSHAYDGGEGLALLSSDPIGFDVVLLDWEMPVMTGIQTLHKIREAGIRVPVVMLTSKNSPKDLQEALDGGANEYMMKPFVSDILVEKIESVLGRGIR